MNETMRKAIMFRTKLRNICLRNPTIENGMVFRKQKIIASNLLIRLK